jgi:hypothetical protein
LIWRFAWEVTFSPFTISRHDDDDDNDNDDCFLTILMSWAGVFLVIHFTRGGDFALGERQTGTFCFFCSLRILDDGVRLR